MSVRSAVPRLPFLRFAALVFLLACAAAGAQQAINTEPSRQTLEEASRDSCEGVSEVVRRCANRPQEADKKPAADPLTKSRAATKAAFDRRDRRSRDAALQAAPVPDAAAAAPGAAQDAPIGVGKRLDGVTVTGTADAEPSLEDVLQRALNPAAGGVPGPNGTTSTYAPDGVRRDCISKCVGPACCATVRTLPNPARDSNGIVGH